MKKLTRDEIKERVEKIRQGLGDDGLSVLMSYSSYIFFFEKSFR